jgi:hypothetical protein
VLPDLLEAARVTNVASEELVMNRKWTRIDVADRVDQTDDAPGAAQIQPGQRLAVARKMEERVAGLDLLAVREQPFIELALLVRGRMQVVPHVGAPAGRAESGEPELGTKPVGNRLEVVQLADVVPGHHD